MKSTDRTAALVLAAGSSTRMGTPKQLLPLGERPLLQAVAEAVSLHGYRPLVIVLGHEARRIRQAVRWPRESLIVENPEHTRGLGSSLRAGLAALAASEATACAIFLADQLVPAEVVRRVEEAFRSTNRPAARPVYRAANGEPVPGHPVFLHRSLWPAATEAEGDAGARVLFLRHRHLLAPVDVDCAPPLDIDTPEDWKALLDGVAPAG